MSTVKTDNLQEHTNGAGISIPSSLKLDDAANGRIGTDSLSAGTVTVANTSVTADTRIFLSRVTQGTLPGHLSYVLNAGVGFDINSSEATDDGDVSWMLVEPI